MGGSDVIAMSRTSVETVAFWVDGSKDLDAHHRSYLRIDGVF